MTPDTRLGLLEVAEGQPLYLKLIRALLGSCRRSGPRLSSGRDSGPAATDAPRLRGTAQSKPLENAPWEAALAWVPNYCSVEEHREFAKAKFDRGG